MSDTGVGIPAAEVGRVFERFHRVVSSGARSIEGSGIGLAIVAEAARAMGGKASATSEVGEGSAFEVRLPLVRAPQQAGRHWAPHVAVGARHWPASRSPAGPPRSHAPPDHLGKRRNA